MDEQRAEFEAWANDAGFNINRQDNDNYLYSATRGAWEAWQAATQRQQERIAELENALKATTEWMEQLRVSGDAGNWEWSEGDEYTNAIAAIAAGKGEG